MKTVKIVLQQYCHEYRVLGDLQTSYGFGDNPELAREDAVYGADIGNHARDHLLGFGDYKVQEDENGDHWVSQINKITLK
jgi:hypothetical protein